MSNGHGGARTGAGRKPGALNQRTSEILSVARDEGRLPLDIMLSLLNESWEHLQFIRDQMINAPQEKKPSIKTLLEVRAECFAYAKDAAPYCHPRLSQVKSETSNAEGNPYKIELTKDEANL